MASRQDARRQAGAAGRNQALQDLLAQLDRSQWFNEEQLGQLQSEHFAILIRHVAAESSFYRQRLIDCGVDPENAALPDLQKLPLLSRTELQAQFEQINCRNIPRLHKRYSENKSSGTTGQTVTVRRTEVCMLFWLALTLREHVWHQRDFTGTLAVIRPAIAELDVDRKGIVMPDWGPPVALLFDSGRAFAMNMQTDVARQAEWLAGVDPMYLLTFPTNLAALIEKFKQQGIGLSGLKQVRTVGETVSNELRQTCREALGVELIDMLSSQELGVIAIQCPESGYYHLMAENLIAEVLRDDGQPCAVGESGRLVITDLHNFATPLIRYDTGDYAERGPLCRCGRGLPTLRRILGRSRHMMVLPDGRRYWPLVGAYRFREVAPVLQYQLIQTTLEAMEVRLVVDRPLSGEEESRLRDVICTSLGHPFHLKFRYFEHEIPRGKNRKFEEFVCLI